MKRPRKKTEQLGYVEGPKDGSYFLRYYGEPDEQGNRPRKAVEVGQKGQFRSKEEANLSIEAAQLRRQINAGVLGRTMGQVAWEFARDHMPVRANTRATVQVCLKHIVARWDGEHIALLAESTESKRIESWLDKLTRIGGTRELSFAARKNIKQQMAALFDFAMGQGYIPSNVNPMERVRLVRREAVRRRQTLRPDEINHFFADPAIPRYVKIMAQVARFSGLRISEIAGLKKSDFDLDQSLVTVGRRIYRGEVAGPKSLKSGEPVPFQEELYPILRDWLGSSDWYPNAEGYLFLSPITERPYSADGMQLRHFKRFGLENGIERFGWHTFRHSYKQYLKGANVPLDEIKRLMRHSRIQTTDDYGSHDMEQLRTSQGRAMRLMDRPALEVVKQKRKWA